jgi:hypothetical protein
MVKTTDTQAELSSDSSATKTLNMIMEMAPIESERGDN